MSNPPYPPLASAAQLAAHLGVESIDPNAAAQALAGASGAVRAFCGWQISQVLDDQIVVDGTGTQSFLLPTAHVTQVYWVQLDYMMLSPVVWDGTQNAQYGFEWTSSGIITRAPMWCWPRGARRITVTLDHGYPVIPDEITACTCAVAARAMDNPESVRMRRVGETAETYDGAALTAYGLSPNDQQTVGRF